MNHISIGSYQAAAVSGHVNQLVLEKNGQLVKKMITVQSDRRACGTDDRVDKEIDLKRKTEIEQKTLERSEVLIEGNKALKGFLGILLKSSGSHFVVDHRALAMVLSSLSGNSVTALLDGIGGTKEELIEKLQLIANRVYGAELPEVSLVADDNSGNSGRAEIGEIVFGRVDVLKDKDGNLLSVSGNADLVNRLDALGLGEIRTIHDFRRALSMFASPFNRNSGGQFTNLINLAPEFFAELDRQALVVDGATQSVQADVQFHQEGTHGVHRQANADKVVTQTNDAELFQEITLRKPINARRFADVMFGEGNQNLSIEQIKDLFNALVIDKHNGDIQSALKGIFLRAKDQNINLQQIVATELISESDATEFLASMGVTPEKTSAYLINQINVSDAAFNEAFDAERQALDAFDSILHMTEAIKEHGLLDATTTQAMSKGLHDILFKWMRAHDLAQQAAQEFNQAREALYGQKMVASWGDSRQSTLSSALDFVMKTYLVPFSQLLHQDTGTA